MQIHHLARKALFCFVIISSFYLQSCSEEKPRLRPSDLVMIDTLFKNQTKLLRIEYDSICAANYQVKLDKAVDSILQLRLAERKKKLGF